MDERQRIRILLTLYEMTMRQAAANAGLSEKYVSDVLAGRVEAGEETYRRIAWGIAGRGKPPRLRPYKRRQVVAAVGGAP